MPITGKETATSGNIKATMKKLFSDTSLARKLRKNMGLGDTLGPLEPQYGGLGTTVNPSILNPSLGWKFSAKKSIKTNQEMQGYPIGGGTIGDKYYTGFKNKYMNTPILVTVTGSGVTSSESLTELKHGGTNQSASFIDDYPADGGTFVMATHAATCALYSYTEAGVKSVLFTKALDSTGAKTAVDKNGNVFIVNKISGRSIECTYVEKGSPEKMFTLQSDGYATPEDILASLVGDTVWIAAHNENSQSTAKASAIKIKSQTIKTIYDFKNQQADMLRTPDGAYIFVRDARDTYSPRTGYRLNDQDVGPSFFVPFTKLNESILEFSPKDYAPSGKNIGICPCGNIAVDDASMSFSPIPYSGGNTYFGIGNEIFEIIEEYRDETNKLTINTYGVEKL